MTQTARLRRCPCNPLFEAPQTSPSIDVTKFFPSDFSHVGSVSPLSSLKFLPAPFPPSYENSNFLHCKRSCLFYLCPTRNESQGGRSLFFRSDLPHSAASREVMSSCFISCFFSRRQFVVSSSSLSDLLGSQGCPPGVFFSVFPLIPCSSVLDKGLSSGRSRGLDSSEVEFSTLSIGLSRTI